MKILVPVALATLLFVGCGDESSKTVEVQEPKKEEIKKVIPQPKEETFNSYKKEQEKAFSASKSVTTVETLFSKCAGCHGSSAEKKALNQSAIIKDWDAQKIEMALNGYKDGSYGGSMKAVMKGQVAKLSSEDIKALAGYISTK